MEITIGCSHGHLGSQLDLGNICLATGEVNSEKQKVPEDHPHGYRDETQ